MQKKQFDKLAGNFCDNSSPVVPELVVQLLCLLSVRSLHVAIVMEGTAGKVVHVDPDGSSPVRRVMLSVVLREREREKKGLHRYVLLPFNSQQVTRSPYSVVESIPLGQRPQPIISP